MMPYRLTMGIFQLIKESADSIFVGITWTWLGIIIFEMLKRFISLNPYKSYLSYLVAGALIDPPSIPVSLKQPTSVQYRDTYRQFSSSPYCWNH